MFNCVHTKNQIRLLIEDKAKILLRLIDPGKLIITIKNVLMEKNIKIYSPIKKLLIINSGIIFCTLDRSTRTHKEQVFIMETNHPCRGDAPSLSKIPIKHIYIIVFQNIIEKKKPIKKTIDAHL